MKFPTSLVFAALTQIPAFALASRPPTAVPVALPLGFEPNVGQADGAARFVAHGSGLNLFLTAAGVVWTIPAETEAGAARALRLSLVGASRKVRLEARDRLPGNANYLIGAAPERWHTGIPTYRTVIHHGLYRGVDLVSHGDRGALEFDFAVAPGADASAIAFRIDGADRMALDAAGDLEIRVGRRELRLKHPDVYQERAGHRERVDGHYRLANGVVRFQLAGRDPHLPLLIDPMLDYAVALGGTDADQGKGVAVDGAGEAFIVGTAASVDFPLQAAHQPAFGGGSSDAFVAKLSADGTTLLYSTYLGGGQNDFGAAIAVGADGTATVTGYTGSIDFPVKIPFQMTYAGALDAFVTRLSPDGSQLAYSTYYGGSGLDQGLAIAVDVAGHAFVTGGSSSTDLPTVAPVQATAGGAGDAFLAIFSPDGRSLVTASYLGGSDSDIGFAIATDSLGQVYLAGNTASVNFPVVNPYQPTYRGGGQDAFLSVINPADAGLVFSTYFGGSNEDTGRGVAVDATGIIYLAGGTYSTDLYVNQPFRGVAVQPALAGDQDGYLIAFDLVTPAAPITTFLGGSDYDGINALTIDGAGNLYVAGETFSADFPVSTPSQLPDGGGNAFLVDLVDGGTQVGFSMLLGGSSNLANGVTTDDAGGIFLVGTTTSADIPGLHSFKADGGVGISAAFAVHFGPPPPDAGPQPDSGPDLDGGPDSGPPDSGRADSGMNPGDGGDGGPQSSQGCSCGAGPGAAMPLAVLGVILLTLRGRSCSRQRRGLTLRGESSNVLREQSP
jgi:hypothetical protein